MTFSDPSDNWKIINKADLITAGDTAIILFRIDGIRERLEFLQSCFNGTHSQHTIAIKTNPHPEILKAIHTFGYGLEAASFEEVMLAAKSGVPDHNIVYNSPVKTKGEIEYCALHFPDIQINANCIQELERYPPGAFKHAGLRINPVVSSNDDSLYNVSGKYSKFGSHIEEKTLKAAILKHNVSTLHVHTGSKVDDYSRTLQGIKKVLQLAERLNEPRERSKSAKICAVNIGGGLSAGSDIEKSAAMMKTYSSEVKNYLKQCRCNYKIITEFGHWIHAHNGIVFSKVEYVRSVHGRQIVYLHVGADLFMRQAYTSAEKYEFNALKNCGDKIHGPLKSTDLAGPLCFNGDYLAKGIKLPTVQENDLIAITLAGANTYGLWSRHCSRTLPKVVGIDMKSARPVAVLSERFNPFLE